MLVGLTGFKGSGKSVVARHLTLRHQYVRRPFAYHLKSMMCALGVPAEILDGSNFDKAKPLEVLGGHSARHAMQTLGTEWGRAHLGENFWVDRWKAGVTGWDYVVADDVRFPNEVEAIKSLGGRVIMIRREGYENPDGHASEQPHKLLADSHVWNNGTPEELCRAVDSLLFPEADFYETYPDEDAELIRARAL